MDIANQNQLAIDTKNLDTLKRSAQEQSPESIKEVAKQFEALFMNMMLKSMRAATPQESQFDNEQTRTFTAMLDQQLSNDLSAKGLGLADILAKQLSKGINPADDSMQQAVSDSSKTTNGTNAKTEINHNALKAYLGSDLSRSQNKILSEIADNMKVGNTNRINNTLSQPQVNNTNRIVGVEGFQQDMKPFADIVSKQSGIPSHYMLGQAALESGWGKREIKGQDGSESYNLFGIKAGKSWKGKTVDTLTTEYINGIKHKKVETFRAYDNYAESFQDFANLMQNNPRYKAVLSNTSNTKEYANALQDAGYATDPNYAKKLINVIGKFTAS